MIHRDIKQRVKLHEIFLLSENNCRKIIINILVDLTVLLC